MFIALAEFVPPELVTIASSCARVDFKPLREEDVVAALVAAGELPERAGVLARLARGRLDRARLLAADPEAEARQRAWEAVPARLDGTGATVAAIADELAGLVERSAAPLVARQQEELAALAGAGGGEVAGNAGRVPGNGPAAKSLRGRGVGRSGARRTWRNATDGSNAGKRPTSSARASPRWRAPTGSGRRPVSGQLRASAAVALIDTLSADLAFNPGELLALQALLVRLDRLAAHRSLRPSGLVRVPARWNC